MRFPRQSRNSGLDTSIRNGAPRGATVPRSVPAIGRHRGRVRDPISVGVAFTTSLNRSALLLEYVNLGGYTDLT